MSHTTPAEQADRGRRLSRAAVAVAADRRSRRRRRPADRRRGAEAGTYRAALCTPASGPTTRTRLRAHLRRYRREPRARRVGAGLAVRHRGRSPAGAWRGPGRCARRRARSSIRACVMKAAGGRQGGQLPELLATAAAVGGRGRRAAFGRATGGFHAARWRGVAGGAAGSSALRARAGCGEGRDARIRVRRIMLKLHDSEAPRLDLAGSLLGRRDAARDRDPRRGRHRSAAGRAPHLAPGQRRARLGAHPELRARARRRAPPASLPRRGHRLARRGHDGRSLPPGPERGPDLRCRLRPATTAANRAAHDAGCASTTLCPVDGGGEPGRIRARISDWGTAGSSGPVVPPPSPVASSTGTATGVGAAEVCVGSLTRGQDAAEQIVATPRTDGDGRFERQAGARAQPRDPDRLLARRRARVGALRAAARWPAAPRLRLRPGGTLSNGDRLHFRVRLPGPAAGARRVNLKALADGHWLRVRGGLTDGRGRWSGSYRFHATTGERTYRFRAFVPRAARLSLRGRASASARRVTVRG